MKPIKLLPVCKDYIWGGEKLATLFNKKSSSKTIAESWELSTHKDGLCLVKEGEFANILLLQYLQMLGSKAISSNVEDTNLPILIKLIDAKNDLSIQVHPDDAFALKNENDLGKTEMWYILDCEKDAAIYYGLNRDITIEALEQHISSNTITELLNKVPVSKGDVFFISPGTIHAIGAGILLAEVQQCSNVTYRVFDYNRLGADGKPRALHIEKTLQVASLTRQAVNSAPASPEKAVAGGSRTLLASCSYFSATSLNVDGNMTLNAPASSFNSLLCLEGSCILKANSFIMEIVKGDSVFVPANFGEYALEGKAKLLLSTL